MATADAQLIGPIDWGGNRLLVPELDDPCRACGNAYSITLAFFLIHYK
jgi:hypothetical protein